MMNRTDTDRDDRKKKIMIVLLLLLLVIAIVGVSYAVFSYFKTEAGENTVGTGTIDMAYQDASNEITITNAMPMTENEASSLTNSSGDGNTYYFDFTVSATIDGDTTINYDVVAVKNPNIMTDDAKNAGKLVSDDDIRFRLEESDDGTTYDKKVLGGTKWTASSANPLTGSPDGAMVLYHGAFGTGSDDSKYQKTDGTKMTRYFRLRMWVDKDYNVDGVAREFSVIVDVYGKSTN